MAMPSWSRLSAVFNQSRSAIVTCRSKLTPLSQHCGQHHPCTVNMVRHNSMYVPRRAILYAPGNDERKLTKAAQLGADCVVMDCEDGVALNRKEEARHTIAKMLDILEFGRSEATVRVNSISSGMTLEDLKVTLSAQNLPATLMLPKVENVQELEQFSDHLQTVLSSRATPGQAFQLVIFVESAQGLLNLADICRAGLSMSSNFSLAGVVFGSDDFLANIGATRTENAYELLYGRQHTIVVAKAYNLQAIDLVHINFRDVESLRRQCIEGAQMGFTGKQAIHPIQIPVIHNCFSPDEKRIEWATQLIEAFHEHQKSGKGAFTFRGSMIDMPLLRQAQNIVELAEVMKDDDK